MSAASFAKTCSGFVASCLIATAAHCATPAVVASDHHSLALGSDGAVWQWGFSNFYAPVGNNQFVRTPSAVAPVRVAGITDVAAIAAGDGHNLALKNDGTLWAWGNNGCGQLGDGTQVARTMPVRVSGLSNVAAVAASGSHTIALTRDGTVWVWGYGFYESPDVFHPNQCGSIPLQVRGLAGVIAISSAAGAGATLSSDGFGLALRSDGSVWRFVVGDRSTPVQVASGLTGIVAIAASLGGNLGVKSDGTVWSLNDPPSAIPGLTGIVTVASSYFHWLALKNDGTVWGWGRDPYGQFGDAGGKAGFGSLTRIEGLTEVISISAGLGHSLAVRNDGSVRGVGHNRDGQLGDGTFAIRLAPVLVVAEGGAGALVTQDWFLDLHPGGSTTLSREDIPAFLMRVSGEPTSTSLSIDADIRFREQDLGKKIHVFAHAPSSVYGACVLSQLTPSGLRETFASALQPRATVASTRGQTVNILDKVSSTQLAASCVCVGVGATGAEAAEPGNVRCVAAFPNYRHCPCPDEPARAAGIDLHPPGSLSGIWWNPAEPGWGIHVTQRGDGVFATWYTYDAAGNAKWYVVPRCKIEFGTIPTQCGDKLYETQGPDFFAGRFDPSAVKASSVGTVWLRFTGGDSGILTTVVNGQFREVGISRFAFASGTTPPPVNYTDLWWDSDESGWGVAITHQFDVMFVTWYVYDNAGKPIWYVASRCEVQGSGCSGTLHRTTGASSIQAHAVGTVTLSFADANRGTLTYVVDGRSGSKPIARQLF